MSSVSIQVISPVLTDFFHCMHCEQIFYQAGLGQKIHRGGSSQYPKEFLEDVARLGDWLLDLSRRYGDRIQLRVLDPQSLEGFFLSLRHWVRRYPTFIVNGRKVFVGSDREGLEQVLWKVLPQPPR